VADTQAERESSGERIANWASHAFGGVCILLVAPSLIATAHTRGGAWGAVGTSVFVGTALLLYVVSTVFHALPPGAAKQLFRSFDHCAIFLLIAGTYTPFTLGVLRGPWGWSLLGVMWGLAVMGIAMKLFAKHRERLSVALYVTMGWLVVIAADPVLRHVPAPGILLLLGGGLAYTLGVVFYVWDRMPYFHFAWHLCVLAGTTLHYFAVRNYSM
jgi:hemolysin III